MEAPAFGDIGVLEFSLFMDSPGAVGRLPDRVRVHARDDGIAVAQTLGAHRLVAETVLDRFD